MHVGVLAELVENKPVTEVAVFQHTLRRVEFLPVESSRADQ